MADLPALVSLPETYDLKNEPPHGWRKMWEEIRQTEDYKKVLAEFDPAISWLETSSDDKELIRLLQKISEGKPPN